MGEQMKLLSRLHGKLLSTFSYFHGSNGNSFQGNWRIQRRNPVRFALVRQFSWPPGVSLVRQSVRLVSARLHIRRAPVWCWRQQSHNLCSCQQAMQQRQVGTSLPFGSVWYSLFIIKDGPSKVHHHIFRLILSLNNESILLITPLVLIYNWCSRFSFFWSPLIG